MMTCNTCGWDADEFREGHCIHCWRDRQNALGVHNARFDRWERLTDAQREREIREASR